MYNYDSNNYNLNTISSQKFIQYVDNMNSENNNILMFDFDQTLIPVHTRGRPENLNDIECFIEYKYNISGKQYMYQVTQKLKEWKKKNYKLYIVTRGLQDRIKSVIDEMFELY